jgi:predicted ATPase/class 3 adenylate cyclase/Tfp pilus assembly protein PilF
MIERALLFSDIVDSTKMVERLGDERAAALWAEHDRQARALLARHDGIEVDRSDGFFLIFARPEDAVEFALDYHALLGTLGLRARCGLHVGPVTLRENAADEVARGAKRFEVEGLAKPLAARVMALAGGGRTLLTRAALDALHERLPESRQIRCHGHYQLKGIAAPAEIFEVGLRDTVPMEGPADGDKAWRVCRVGDLWLPVRQLRHNLPAERDAFVGRTAELSALAERLDQGARLVSVVGPGGTGKTRFVSRYAWQRLGNWPGGIYFCDLSDARDRDGILATVAAALGVPLDSGGPLAQLGHAIAGRGRCLLILDNFEQIVEHAEATIGAWLDRAADAVFVVTSRERLQVPGEEVFPLEPLPAGGDGVELFARRAHAQSPDFALGPDNRPTVERVVALLDGLPLAIELAAAHARTLSPAQLLDRLKDRFRILAGLRGARARQATLKAAIDWSWHLLAPWERAALAQCAVFEGSFTLDAAEEILDLSAWAEAPPVFAVVQALVDKSLLRSWVPGDTRRYAVDEPYFGMYLSIHEFAAEKLAAAGDAARRVAEARHGAHFGRFGSDEAIDALSGPGGAARKLAFALDLGNLTSACRRAVARRDAAVAAATCRAACVVIDQRGPVATGAELSALVLGLEGLDDAQRATALATASAADQRMGRMLDARNRLRQALELFRRAGDRRGERAVLAAIGGVCRMQGRMDEARGHFTLALAMCREAGDRRTEGRVLGQVGSLCSEQGRNEAAREHYEQALGIYREIGDRDAEGHLLNTLGVLQAEQGGLTRARTLFEAALASAREIGDRISEGEVLTNLGCLHHEQGRFGEARVCYDSSLQIHREAGNRRFEGYVLGDLGRLQLQQGQWAEARDCLQRSLAIMREIGDRRIEGSELRSLGELSLREGRLDEAQAEFAAAEAVLRDVGDKFYLAFVLCGRAEVALLEGRMADADALCRQSEALAEATSSGADSDLGRRIAALRDRLA